MLIKIDVAARTVLGTLELPRRGQPQDVKTAPDGTIFYVADMQGDGVYGIDGHRFTLLDFLPTGTGGHGLYASRDSKVLSVANRGAGSVSRIDFATRKVLTTWVSQVETAPIWEASQRTARSYGWLGATMRKSMPWIRPMATSWPAFPWARVPTGCVSIPNLGARLWGIRVCCGEAGADVSACSRSGIGYTSRVYS